MLSSSGTPNRNRALAAGRCRSLSLEESAEEPASYGGTPSEKEVGNKTRRRLNTYINSRDPALPTQKSLEEAADEDTDDGAFGESVSGPIAPNGVQAQSLIAKSELAFYNFLQRHPCYDLMPHSSKLVVFDTRLCGRKAFFAMMHNGVSAAMLWSAERQTFVGVLTVCDFIRAMVHQYVDGVQVLEEQCVESWLQYNPDKRRMTTIGPEESLARATNLLLASRIRRLPVCDPATGNILCTIAHKHILRLVYANLSRLLKPRSWFRTLSDLGIGTFTEIATITPQSRIIDALRLLVERHISALPVVSSADGRLIGVFSRSDTLLLAVDSGYMHLDRTIADVMPFYADNAPRPPSLGPLRVCTMEETLGTIVEKFVRGKVHRLIVVDSSRKVIGVLSLTDILRFFIRAPPLSVQTPGGTVNSVFTASAYDLSNASSIDQIATSQSLFAAPSPVACMSLANSNGSLSAAPVSTNSSARVVATSHHHQTQAIRLDTTFESGVGSDDSSVVSASLPACPGPARQMAFATEISS